MRMPPYLARRPGTRNYSARVPMPKALRELRKAAGLPASDTWQSLGTSDLKEAALRLTPAVLEIRDAHEAELAARQAGTHEERPAGRPHKPSQHELANAAWQSQVPRLLRAHEGEDGLADFLTSLLASDQRDTIRKEAARQPLAVFSDLAERIARERGWKLAKGTPEFTQFCKLLAESSVTAIAAMDARDAGAFSSDTANPKPPAAPPSPTTAPTKAAKGRGLMELLERYVKDRSGKVTAKELANARATVKLFAEMVGERRDASAISRRDAIAYKDALRSYPRGASRSIDYRGMTLPEIVRAVEAEPEANRPRLIDPVTINHYLHRMSAFWRWVVKHDADAQPRIFEDLTFEADKRERSRDSFTAENMAAIFNAPEFNTAADPDSFAYWGPILASFTGARLKELCQLRTADVSKQGGRQVLTITDEGDGQTLKTRHSRRTVPLHKDVLRLGFADLVARRKAAGEDRLFPGEKPNRYGYFDASSKAFSKFMRKVGVGVGQNGAFHRFRHTIHDYMRAAGFTASDYQPLFGHAKGDTSGNYGSREDLTIARRSEMVDALPGLPMLKPIKRKSGR